MKSFNILQDQADACVKELGIPNTLEKLENTGKGAVMSFGCNVNYYINSIHAFNDEGY